MTHADFVELAASWLCRRCCFVLTEQRPLSCRESADAIGWNSRGDSILVECKVSRSDFLADAKKLFRNELMGMGRSRYYMTLPGIIAPKDLPPFWGLLIVSGRGIRVPVAAVPRETFDRAEETRLLLNVGRRAYRYALRPDVPKLGLPA